MPTKQNKQGRWTKKEHEFLRENMELLTTEELAKALNRPLEAVEEAKKALGAKRSINDLKRVFQDSHKWKQLESELTPDELSFFAQEYAEFAHQFQDDILSTEQTQIFMAIKLSILMHRNLAERKTAEVDSQRIRELYEQFKDTADDSKASQEQAMEFERLLKSIEVSNNARTRDYLSMSGEYNEILKSLKATRDKRIDNIEKNNVSFIDILKKIQDKKFRSETGRELEMFKKGMKKHKETILEAEYVFADGEIETPLIKSEE